MLLQFRLSQLIPWRFARFSSLLHWIRMAWTLTERIASHDLHVNCCSVEFVYLFNHNSRSLSECLWIVRLDVRWVIITVLLICIKCHWHSNCSCIVLNWTLGALLGGVFTASILFLWMLSSLFRERGSLNVVIYLVLILCVCSTDYRDGSWSNAFSAFMDINAHGSRWLKDWINVLIVVCPDSVSS